MADQRHGVDGWDLVDYEWRPKTGEAEFTYERGHATRVVTRSQPSLPTHDGWTRDASHGVLALDDDTLRRMGRRA